MGRLKTLQPRVPMLGSAERKPWQKSALSPKRLTGRRGVERRHRWLAEHPLCAHCYDQTPPRITAAQEVDHVVPLSQGGKDDESNFQSLCIPCHQEKTKREGGGAWWQTYEYGGSLSQEAQERRMPTDLSPSRIPLTMVCGPPASGKSTYITQNATADDVVIDLDQIMQSMSGLPEHQTSIEWLPRALEERNRRLRALASDETHRAAFFVISAPDPIERATWARRLGADVVVLATPLDECLRRIDADPARIGHTERMKRAAIEWWAAAKSYTD